MLEQSGALKALDVSSSGLQTDFPYDHNVLGTTSFTVKVSESLFSSGEALFPGNAESSLFCIMFS
jgi:hypothetical protein